MGTAPTIPEASVELLDAEGTTRVVRIETMPFRIGRGVDTSNHVRLDDRRISRRCLSIAYEDGRYFLEDIGQRNGVFVNGNQIEGSQNLYSGDIITFGQVDNLQIVFRAGPAHDALPHLLSRLEKSDSEEEGDADLRHLSLLLEATALLQSELPVEEVIAAMVDRALVVTDADRGLLLRKEGDGGLHPMAARRKAAESLPSDSLAPSQTIIAAAIQKKRSIVEVDLGDADKKFKEAKSVIAQQLRSVMAIPLYSLARLHSPTTTSVTGSGELLGVLYLDSRRTAAFSSLDRQILDALAAEATSVIENAQLLARERERRRFEQELSIARDIQQALLPKGLKAFPHCLIAADNNPCYLVGGDYFDLMELDDGRMGFVLADVSGKGLPAALLTSMLQGCFAGMALGRAPSELMDRINQFVCSRSDANRYATLFFGILDSSGHLDYINAGHHSPLLIRNGKVTEPFPSGCVPLGLLEGTKFQTCSAELQPGDTMLLYTDGVTEAENTSGEELGMDRLRKMVEARTEGSVEELQNAVLGGVNDFARGAQQADDITLLVLRYQNAA